MLCLLKHVYKFNAIVYKVKGNSLSIDEMQDGVSICLTV